MSQLNFDKLTPNPAKSWVFSDYFENSSVEEEFIALLKQRLAPLQLSFSIGLLSYALYEATYFAINNNLIELYWALIIEILLIVLYIMFFMCLRFNKKILPKYHNTFSFILILLCLLIFVIRTIMIRLSKQKVDYDYLVKIDPNFGPFSEADSCVHITQYENYAVKATNQYFNSKFYEGNFIFASIEGIGYNVFSTKHNWITILFIVVFRFSTFFYLKSLTSLEIEKVLASLAGVVIIYIMSFMLKYSTFKSHLDIFITNKKCEGLNQYFEGFILDMNSHILTINKEWSVLNKNKLFSRDFNCADNIRSTPTEDKVFPKETDIGIITTEREYFKKTSVASLLSQFISTSESNNLLDYVNPIILEDKSTREKNGSQEMSKFNVFKSLGLFKIMEGEAAKFFEISVRSFYSLNIFYCIDFIFIDITSLKESESKNAEYQIKGKMFSKIAHEFKTPLITITSELDALNDKMQDVETCIFKQSIENQEELKGKIEQVKTISASIKHLADYTNFLILDIIQYSNTNYNEIDIKFENIDNLYLTVINFANLILNALLTYATGDKKKIQSKLLFDSNLNGYTLSTDTTRLKQIILNLISNAVKFTKKGTISLFCYLRENEEQLKVSRHLIPDKLNTEFYINRIVPSKLSSNYKELIISVKDSGLGIPLPIIQNLVQGNYASFSFRDYNNSMGSGLGLGIASKLCSLMNYGLKVSSIENVGTIFELVIPILHKANSQLIKINVMTSNLGSISNINSVEEDEIVGLADDQSFIEEDFRNAYSRINTRIKMSNKNLNYQNFKKSIILEIPKENSPKICTNYLECWSLNDKKQSIKKKIQSNTSLNIPILNLDADKDMILICDDSQVILDSLEKILKSIKGVSSRYLIVKVEDGAFMLTTIIKDQTNNKIKAVFSDENMQYLNGSLTIKLIKELESNGKIASCIKYICVTAFEDEYFKLKLLKEGFHHVITKPSTKQSIYKCLSDFSLI